jgi:hypothetical protein
MCLSSITERADVPSQVIISAQKLFNRPSGGELRFNVQKYKGSFVVPLDKWLKAEGESIKMDSGFIVKDKYPAGFHVYDADEKKTGIGVRRVYVRGVRTIGTQDDYKVLVADELYVPSDQDAWPPKE